MSNYFEAFSKPRLGPQKRNAFKTSLGWLLALVIALTLIRFVFQSYLVFGESMQPTLQDGDYLIISRINVTWSQVANSEYNPSRGDIVVINSPLDGKRIIKRVIAIEDERVIVSNGQLKVYNQQNSQGFDPYDQLELQSQFVSGEISMIVPKDHIFVVGDNREHIGSSLDSRNELGPVPIDNIIGKLVLRLWPFSKLETF